MEKIEIITKYQQLAEIIEEKIRNGEYKKGEKLPSERKIAEIYGISHMTVNKAFSLLVAKKILKRMHGNGTYVISKEESVTSNFVALFLPTNFKDHPLFYPLLPNKLQENGFYPIILDITFKNAKEKFEKLDLENPKAFIIDMANLSFWNEIKKTVKTDTLIFINHFFPGMSLRKTGNNFILSNYELAGYLGIKTLIKNKRKKILILGCEIIKGSSYNLFLNGCKNASKEYEVEIKDIIDTNYMSEKRYFEYFKLNRDIDGILSYGDFRVIPVLKVFEKLSIRVPEDVAIIGTYNTPWAEIYELTSISINQEEIVKEVVKCLKEGRKGYFKIINPKIIFRKSCIENERR